MSEALTTSRSSHPPQTKRSHIATWALWDWGSAAFNAVMITFVFGTYLASEGFGADDRGTSWLAAGNAIAGAIIALTAPVIGRRADNDGRRTLWLGVNTGLVIVTMAACFFVQPQESYLLLGVILLSVGNVFFEFAGVQYNAMLVNIANQSTIGRISGLGWGAGYLGGIFLLLLVYVGFISGDTHWFGITNDDALNIRFVAVFAALWFLVFALPVLIVMRNRNRAQGCQRSPRVSILQSYRQLIATIVELWKHRRNTFWFFVASAIFRDGVGAVFAYGAILGTTVYGVDPGQILFFGIAANVVAAAGAFIGGLFDDRFGPKRIIVVSLLGLIVSAVIIFVQNGTLAFWIWGLFLCFFVGPVQSSSRAFLGRLTTAQTAGEMYGLYATTGRSVSFLTPTLIAIFVGMAGESRMMVPAIIIVLAAGLLMLWFVKDPQTSDDEPVLTDVTEPPAPE
ncbi:MFS transporter [Enteractinococcus coprophilus]|uniref:UMF1 family MFS transporter n=1 Tax=Enteractinococcus coprophilus TaxID=1027633 RepID=A0A543AIU0_9MICC|nr:MFS transporter [Enteractinococcus coprophilus]TQL72490.1 UMF1 family MFS transporter [Enteractinococcus coprophilus]